MTTGNHSGGSDRPRGVCPAIALLAALTALSMVACGSDDAEVGTGGTTRSTTVAPPPATAPERAPDLRGTITSVTPFVPVTEDCVPPEDVDPNGAVSSDDPPVCTPADNDVLGSILVEELPDRPSAGRKISFSVTTASALVGLDGFDDLREGMEVDTWVAGDVCAESYPEQCGLEALVVAAPGR